MKSRRNQQPARRALDGTFAARLTAAIAAKGVTLAHLEERLRDRGSPVSLATLSYWRSGRRQPERASSLDAVAELEDLLGLAAGDLTTRLGPSRRPGPAGELAPVPDVVADQASLVDEALSGLGLHGAPMLGNETLHIVVDVDAAGQPRVVTVSGIWRALKAEAQSLPLIYVNDAPILVPPRITVSGGHLGRDRSRLAEGLVAREFVLERPLRVGEQVVLEQRTEWRTSVHDDSYEHYVVQRIREFTLWVRFDAAKVPASAQSFTIDDDEVVHDFDLTDVTTVHHVVRGFGPGRVGVRWTW